MLVHVRCITVSMEYTDCVRLASSRLRSLVEPPAPQVMLIASGLSVHSREIRPIKFSNPLYHFSTILDGRRATNLACARGKELESVERA